MVMLLLAILSVSVGPKFSASKGYHEYGYRSETITKLRAVQLRAMQHHCATVQILSLSLTVLNPDPNPDNIDCAKQTLQVRIEAGDNVHFDVPEAGITIKFDAMGRPLNAVTEAIQGRTINLIGDETLSIVIESQGYIHAL